MNLEQLREPFGFHELEWLIVTSNGDRTSALVVPYVRREAIMDRLDDVCGPDGWRVSFQPGAHGGVICTLEIWNGEQWIAKQDGAENTDVQPVKGGISAAFKRAATQWGIGRYLADAEKVWTKAKPIGNKGVEIAQLPDEARVFPKGDKRTPVSRMADRSEQHPADEHGDGTLTVADWGAVLQAANTTRGLTMADYARLFQISQPDSPEGKKQAVPAITAQLQAAVAMDGVTLEQACDDLADRAAAAKASPADAAPPADAPEDAPAAAYS